MPDFFLDKIAGLRPTTLLKKSLWHRRFPLNSAKFLRTPFLQNISERLLLSVAENITEPTLRANLQYKDHPSIFALQSQCESKTFRFTEVNAKRH